MVDKENICDILPAKKEVNINTLDFLEIKDVKNNILITNDKYIRILKVYPINYDLKSDFEKEAIINAYKTVFKTCDFDFQILILSQKENIDNNIKILNTNLIEKTNYFDRKKLFEVDDNSLDKQKFYEYKIEKNNKIFTNYIKFINKLNYEENITSKSFYIIISEERIKENIDYFNFFNIKNFKKIKNDSKKLNKNEENSDKTGLHNITKLNEKSNFEKSLKNIIDKENKLINTLSKCGNNTKILNKNEVYELFIFSKKGENNF